jgi:hypothetical protein
VIGGGAYVSGSVFARADMASGPENTGAFGMQETVISLHSYSIIVWKWQNQPYIIMFWEKNRNPFSSETFCFDGKLAGSHLILLNHSPRP